MPLRLDASAADFEGNFQAYLDTGRDDEDRVDAAVAEIIAHVRSQGDAALLDYTKRFDRLDLVASQLRVGADEIAAAVEACPLDVRAAIDFAARGVQAECIKLNGAMELAPSLGLCDRIVDLVSSVATLKANGLVEVEHIADITSRLIVNRTALKTRSEEIGHWVDRFREACNAA